MLRLLRKTRMFLFRGEYKWFSHRPIIRTVPYNIEGMTKHLKNNNFPKKLVTALETGTP